MIEWLNLMLHRRRLLLSPSLTYYGERRGGMMIYWTNFVKVLQHKWFVLVAGLRVGKIPLWRLIFHDMSKFSRAEFGPYARKFLVEGSTAQTEFDFALAWLNHENRNPHHWGYWIPRTGKHAGRPLPMPEHYAREMVADWWAAGRAYGKSWDMREWLVKSVPGFNLHDETLGHVYRALSDIGYIETVQEVMQLRRR